MEIFTKYDLKCYLRNAPRGKMEFTGSLTYLSQRKPELRGILQNCFQVWKVLTCHFNSQGRGKKSQLWEKKVKKPKKQSEHVPWLPDGNSLHGHNNKCYWEDGGRKMGVGMRMKR